MLSDSPVSANIGVKDLEHAKAFYGETLGLKTKMENEGIAVYECGGGTHLIVYKRDEETNSPATVASFQVNDIAAEVEALKAKDVIFEYYENMKMDESNIADNGNSKAAWFKDLEGNILALIQM